MIYTFDDCELDTRLFELRRGGMPVPMEPQVFEVLAHLVENDDRVVPKEELLDKVWPERFVTESALNSRVMAARKAIGDSGKDQRLIKTVRGRGYRFVGELRADGAATAQVSVASQERARTAQANAGEQIRFCRASDGTQLAYATLGSGPPLVKAANWLTHLDYDYDSPVWATS